MPRITHDSRHFCFLLTAELKDESIEPKWKLRRKAALTEQALRNAVERDGANLAFARMIGGVDGMIAAIIEGSGALVK